MPKVIDAAVNRDFGELEHSPGELIAFDNRDADLPHPFLLMIHERGACWHDSDKGAINLIYVPVNGIRQNWRVYPNGYALGLWTPQNGQPKFDKVREIAPERAYVVERAYAGKDAILRALDESKQGLRFYAGCIRDRRMIVERGAFDRLLGRIGVGMLLPNPVRFR